MSQQTEQKQQSSEGVKSSTTAKKTRKKDYSKEVVLKHKSEDTELYQIKDTPFHALRLHGEWALILGKHRVSEPVETLEEVIKESQKMTWNRITVVITEIFNALKNNEQWQNSPSEETA